MLCQNMLSLNQILTCSRSEGALLLLLFVYLLLNTIIINLATYWFLYFSTAQFYKLLIDSMISNQKYQFYLICYLDNILMLSKLIFIKRLVVFYASQSKKSTLKTIYIVSILLPFHGIVIHQSKSAARVVFLPQPIFVRQCILLADDPQYRNCKFPLATEINRNLDAPVQFMLVHAKESVV